MALAAARRSLLIVTAAALLLQLFVAGPATVAGPTGQLTVFWGRNKDEGSLREACDTGLYTVVVMSFLNVDGHGEYGLDIKHCQSKGILVSLSIGGPRGAYSLPTKQSALDLFDHLWNSYLGGGSRRDGVDFFVEHAAPAERYDVLATELARQYVNTRVGPAGNKLKPDDRRRAAAVGRALATGVFERIHVRFYDDTKCSTYWRSAWNEWTAAYPRSTIYLGLSAAREQDSRSGYIHPKSLYDGVVPVVQKATNYGGLMVWDRYSDKKSGYSYYLKKLASASYSPMHHALLQVSILIYATRA